MLLQGEYGVAVGIFDMASRWLRASPWRLIGVVCITGFLAGSLLDLDHIPFALGVHIGYVPFESLAPTQIQDGRNLHGLALVGGGIMCACAGGYLYWMVLNDVARVAILYISRKIQDLLKVKA